MTREERQTGISHMIALGQADVDRFLDDFFRDRLAATYRDSPELLTCGLALKIDYHEALAAFRKGWEEEAKRRLGR